MNEKTKAMLDAHHKWPETFRFKFIVPAASIPLFEAKLSPEEKLALVRRPSENAAYMAFTMALMMESSDAVLAVYARMKDIPGLLSL